MGVPWGSLGPSRGLLGVSLTLSWHHFPHFGGTRGPLWAFLGLFCHFWKPIEAFWHLFEAFCYNFRQFSRLIFISLSFSCLSSPEFMPWLWFSRFLALRSQASQISRLKFSMGPAGWAKPKGILPSATQEPESASCLDQNKNTY